MRRYPWLILAFAIAFAIFFIAPPLLGNQFSLYRLMKIGDVFDIFTPLVLIPLYWLLYSLDAKKPITRSGISLFLVLSAFWVEGQGMHLSANSIGHLLEEMKSSGAYHLTFFYDETLSHYLWHFGIIGLSALLFWRQWRNLSSEECFRLWPLILAGVIYGFTFFMIVVEAGTAPLGLPLAILFAVSGWILGRKRIRQQPLLAFLTVSYSLATVLFGGWAVYWGGLPQFSEVGIID